MLTLYELCGADKTIRFSPYVWRVRFALAHLGLDYQGVPISFLDKQAIAPSGQGKVPVLVDGEEWVHDSWHIAVYLHEHYGKKANTPLINKDGLGALWAFNQMVDAYIAPCFRPFIVLPVIHGLDKENADYFRQTREKLFGMRLEDFAGNLDEKRENLWKTLSIFHPILDKQLYFGGDTPNYADHILMGCFMWGKSLSDYPLLKADDPLFAWRKNMLDAYDGMAKHAAGFPIQPA